MRRSIRASFPPTLAGLIRLNCFYPAIPCLGRRSRAVPMAMGWFLPSTLTAAIIRCCTLFPPGRRTVSGIYTNTDGTSPSGGLVLSGNTLYGTADRGGTNGSGFLVFALETSGSNFIVLHYFAAEATNSLKLYTNLDGIYPGGLTLSGSTLYGVAEAGGTNGEGTLYSMGTNGLEFTMLHTFGVTRAPTDTNSDGANPSYGLLLVGTNLYGAAQSGGTAMVTAQSLPLIPMARTL